MKISEKLKDRLEKELGLNIAEGPERIYGLKGAAHRWLIVDVNKKEYTSEDTMKESLNAKSLGIYESLPNTHHISID